MKSGIDLLLCIFEYIINIAMCLAFNFFLTRQEQNKMFIISIHLHKSFNFHSLHANIKYNNIQ